MSAQRIAITGATGLLGSALVHVATTGGDEVIPIRREDWDLSHPASIHSLVEKIKPRLIVHCAAATNVDWCESDAAKAATMNTDATGMLAEAATASGARLVYISSCGIFDGRSRVPYTEADVPAPLTAYARTKFEAEDRVWAVHPRGLVCRVGWLFGGSRLQKKNFVEARRRETQTAKRLVSANDKWGSPTWVEDAAGRILELARLGASGVVHVANSGVASRFDYVHRIVKNLRVDAVVEGVDSGHFKRSAPVPDFEALASTRLSALGLVPLRFWGTALDTYMAREFPETE